VQRVVLNALASVAVPGSAAFGERREKEERVVAAEESEGEEREGREREQ
jgi:hypothetical protein